MSNNLLFPALIGLGALAFFTGGAKAAPQENTMFQNNQRQDYLIWKDGDTFYSRNERTGTIDYSDTDAYTVINDTYQSASQDSYIYIKPGIYEFGNNTLIMNRPMDGFIFEMSPRARIIGFGTNPLFIIDSNVRSKFIFGSLEGVYINPTSGSPLLYIRPKMLGTANQYVMILSDLEVNEIYNAYEGIRIDTTYGSFAGNRMKINHIDATVNTGINIADVPSGNIVEGNCWDINYIKYPGANHNGIGIYDGTGQDDVNIFRINSLDGTFGDNQNGTGLYSNAISNMYIIGSTVSGDPAIHFTSTSHDNILQIGFNGARESGTGLLDQGTNNTLIIGHPALVKAPTLQSNITGTGNRPLCITSNGVIIACP